MHALPAMTLDIVLLRILLEVVDTGGFALAAHNRLRGVALTDHDTVEGVAEFLQLGEQAGLTVLSGVEVSCSLRQHTLHMLGYGIDHTDPDLHAWLAPLQSGYCQPQPNGSSLWAATTLNSAPWLTI